MHDFNPGNRSEEEFDEVEDLLQFLGEQSEVNNILGEEQQILMMMNDSTDDEEYNPNETVSNTSMSEDESSNEEEAPKAPETSSQVNNERRIIDDYNPDEEDDEIVKKIILELKKPRSKPPNIETQDYTTDLSFHPSRNLIAVSTINGDVLIYEYSNEENKLLNTHEIHTKAVRDIEFSADGKDLFSASRDKSIIISDFETGKFKRLWEGAHDEPIYTITVVNENLLASGDDEGTVKVWDCRDNSSSPVFSVKEIEDYVSSIITNSQKRLLICTSGDGFMTTINIPAKKMIVQSESYEEELACAGLFRNESKLVVGSSKGNFYTFNWDQFGYHNDSFSGPSTPISFMIPITERIALTAGEEGVIRALHLFPGKFLGVVGQHSLAVESMDISHDGEIIASSSHDNDIRFWNIKYFEDFDTINYNSKPDRNSLANNLPSSLKRNRSDFFSDMAS